MEFMSGRVKEKRPSPPHGLRRPKRNGGMLRYWIKARPRAVIASTIRSAIGAASRSRMRSTTHRSLLIRLNASAAARSWSGRPFRSFDHWLR